MVGNANPYTVKNWASDIALASSKGLDGFVLNVGSDSWQLDKVADAFTAAQSANSSFERLRHDGHASYIKKYSIHPNVLQFEGKMLISTFSGEKCQFGQSTVDAGWTSAIKTGMPPVHFIPAFFVDSSTIGSYPSSDGLFNSKADTSFDTDTTYVSALGGKTYLGAVSPWFFTHYEVLIKNRAQVPIVEVITWNDYGEAHYIGPIEGSQPNSQAWVNGFDHQGWLDIMKYYIEYYKTGSAPTISKDRIFLWAKLYSTNATAPDPIGPPRDAPDTNPVVVVVAPSVAPPPQDWAADMLWAEFHLTEAADLTLICGSSTQTFSSVPAGLSKQKLALTEDCDISAKITRGGSDAVTFAPAGMNFSTTAPSYNFNAFVAASPA
ncbi:glycoside hydrolase family 71 protein [Mycena epipterygia]|nr:glycoside hydrolase family 71 protein [Mycena epipterygia]